MMNMEEIICQKVLNRNNEDTLREEQVLSITEL